MATRAINVLGLCAGIGGLEVGVRLAIPGSRTVCYVEREAFAAAALVARMETQDLDPAPVWDDLCTFDGRPWRGVVDLIAAGFPCQPASCAGRRRGTSDDRWLWPHVARIVGEVRPALVVLENVRGLLSVNAGAAFKSILRDFSSMGFAAEWGVVRASDAGAPHQRARVFVLAHQPGRGRGILRDACRAWDGGHADGGNEGVADAEDADGRRGGPFGSCGAGQRGRGLGSDGAELAYPERTRFEGGVSGELAGSPERGPDADACGSGGDALPAFPPGPSDLDAWSRVLAVRPDLAPAVVVDAKRRMLKGSRPDAADGTPGSREGEPDQGCGAVRVPVLGRCETEEVAPQPEVRRVDDGAASGLVRDSASRIDQLRALGNAVVPAQAALALRVLVERLLKEET